MSSNRKAISIGVTLALVVLGILVYVNRTSATSDPAIQVSDPHGLPSLVPTHMDELASVPVRDSGSQVIDVIPSGTTATRSTTFGAVLEEFWGDRWPDVRKRVKQDLDQPRIAPPPWSDVVGSVCERMHVSDADSLMLRLRFKLPSEISREWLVQRLGIAADIEDWQVSELRDRLRVPFEDGTRAFDRVMQAIDRALAQKCARNDYEYSPFTTIRMEPFPKDAIQFGGVGIQGWSVSFFVRPTEIPEADPDLATLDRVGNELAAIIGKWSEEHRPR